MISISRLIEIVKSASDKMQGRFDVKQKDGYANIVTSSDVAVQEYLKERLAAEMPGCGFICEEDDRHDTSHRHVWIIDPIDGTANYSRGIGQCAICVGLMCDHAMEKGVVYLPWTGELFHAERGRGAWLNGKRIHVSDRAFENAVMCTALPVYHKEHAGVCSEIILDTFKQCNDIRRFGAAAPEICYMAMGRVELYFEYMLSPWDFAAASLILTEAGGVMSDERGNPVDPASKSALLGANTPDNLHRLQAIVQAHLDC